MSIMNDSGSGGNSGNDSDSRAGSIYVSVLWCLYHRTDAFILIHNNHVKFVKWF